MIGNEPLPSLGASSVNGGRTQPKAQDSPSLVGEGNPLAKAPEQALDIRGRRRRAPRCFAPLYLSVQGLEIVDVVLRGPDSRYQISIGETKGSNGRE